MVIGHPANHHKASSQCKYALWEVATEVLDDQLGEESGYYGKHVID
jgi:hypothetical protein